MRSLDALCRKSWLKWTQYMEHTIVIVVNRDSHRPVYTWSPYDRLTKIIPLCSSIARGKGITKLEWFPANNEVKQTITTLWFSYSATVQGRQRYGELVPFLRSQYRNSHDLQYDKLRISKVQMHNRHSHDPHRRVCSKHCKYYYNYTTNRSTTAGTAPTTIQRCNDGCTFKWVKEEISRHQGICQSEKIATPDI